MTNALSALEQLNQAPNLRELLDQLEQKWQDEQRRRGRQGGIYFGEIIYHSPVYGRHWKASTRITRYLVPHVYDSGLGEVGYEKVMIRLTRNDYEPDICFWSNEKAANFGLKQSAFPAPDFIIEILSDSTKDRDWIASLVGVKMTDYALHDVQEYWIVDTEHETIEQYLLEGNAFTLAQKLKDGVLASEAVPGFTIDVKSVFTE